MPLYDYDCLACGRRVEVVHGVHAPGPTHCPNCGSGPLKKAIAAPAIHFKGSGWAKRDRRATVTSGSKASESGATAEGPTSDSEPTKTAATDDKSSTSGTSTGSASDRPASDRSTSDRSTASSKPAGNGAAPGTGA